MGKKLQSVSPGKLTVALRMSSPLAKKRRWLIYSQSDFGECLSCRWADTVVAGGWQGQDQVLRSKCTGCNKFFYQQAIDIHKLNRLTTNQPDLFHNLPDDIQGKLGALNFDSWDDVESTLQCPGKMVQKIKQLSENAVEKHSKGPDHARACVQTSKTRMIPTSSKNELKVDLEVELCSRSSYT